MACCRCNRAGICRGCVCVKAKRPCVDCLPSKQGNCANLSTAVPNASSNAPSDATSDAPPAVTTLLPPITSLSSDPMGSIRAVDGALAVARSGTPPTSIAVPISAPRSSESTFADQQPFIGTTPPAVVTAPQWPEPDQDPCCLEPPNFTWGEHSGQEMYDVINSSYEEVIHWKPNLFLVPFGSAGTSFVKEIARLFQAFADGSSLECVSMKAITLAQILLLQKPSRRSKTKEHVCHLKRRLDLWSKGDIQQLLEEGRCIQARLISRMAPGKNDVNGHIFRSLMAQGKIHSALSYLSREQTGGILGLDDIIPQSQGLTTRDILREKHPPGKPACPESLLPDCTESVNPIIYSDLDAECILQAALHTQGASGLSGLDAYAWRRLCSSFKSSSHDLCHALAAVGCRICTSNIHPDNLSAFVSCRLISLNKNPGVRPIGVGEVPRRIIAKAILSLFHLDIQDAAGSMQLCAGQDGGCEAAIHAMHQFFVESEVHGVLLVDASNAFNTINRQAALHNIKSICPPLYQVLMNTYKAPVRCIICGDGEITSSEGTTQGDPLAMAMYALAVKPLIGELKSDAPSVKQVWYADDASGAGTCEDLRKWWDSLQIHGAGYGYYPNASKTNLVVKAEHAVRARELFADTGIHITTEGKRHLGAVVGSRSYTEEYVSRKVENWTEEIKRLAHIAQTQPHAAYSAYTHGLSSRWSFLSRTIPDIADLLNPLEEAIQQYLIPALTGRPPCSREERDLLALPVRFGGMGITNPASTPHRNFEASKRLTSPLVATIATQDQDRLVDISAILEAKASIRQSNREFQTQLAESVHGNLSPQLKRHVDLAMEKGASSWLSVLPLDDHNFSLHKGAFRDAICLRYGWKPLNTPAKCSCGTGFSTDHAIICSKGGFPTIRHNELRDVTASLLSEVCHNVATEPRLQPLSGESLTHRTAITSDDARLDIRARGFWSPAQDAYFDVRVFYPNAPSNRSGSLSAAYKKHEVIKKRAYGQRVRDVEGGVFTPLVFSTTGGMGREATTFYKRLADLLAQKQLKPYPVVINWLRCKLSFAAVRSSIMCIRGTRSSINRPLRDADIILATSEGGIPQDE